jgi:hypothetical protein
VKRAWFFILSISGFLLADFAFNTPNKEVQKNSDGFALIELFTSEGCSSCPPAEEVMKKLIEKANTNALPVYVIEFHVDYWNYLGWKDTFAFPEYSQRQQRYGDIFKLNSVYTPQAIVNGESEMTGSDNDKINTAVESELQRPSSVNIVCKVTKTANSKMDIDYSITGNISGCDLNLVLVESNLVTYIKKGENAHKTLTHDNVARIFKNMRLNSVRGKIAIDVSRINLSNAKLICFVQNTVSMKITGATQIKI